MVIRRRRRMMFCATISNGVEAREEVGTPTVHMQVRGYKCIYGVWVVQRAQAACIYNKDTRTRFMNTNMYSLAFCIKSLIQLKRERETLVRKRSLCATVTNVSSASTAWSW
jgi:hypothetical protein